jgi:hypothetical protein
MTFIVGSSRNRKALMILSHKVESLKCIAPAKSTGRSMPEMRSLGCAFLGLIVVPDYHPADLH